MKDSLALLSILLVGGANIHPATAQLRHTDLFNYGIGYDANVYEGGETSRPSFSQDYWDFVTCAEAHNCTGYPNKFPTVLEDPGTYGWTITDRNNRCAWCPASDLSQSCGTHRQSPIDLKRFPGVTTHPEAEQCSDWEAMEYEDGSCQFDDIRGHFTIERHALQIHTPTNDDGTIDCEDQPGEMQFPRLGFTKGAPDDWWHLARTDITMPSQHWQEKNQYAAEVTLAHFFGGAHPEHQMGYVSIFMQDYPDETAWPFLDKLICQWRDEEERVRSDCGLAPAEPYENCALYRDQSLREDQEDTAEPSESSFPSVLPTGAPSLSLKPSGAPSVSSKPTAFFIPMRRFRPPEANKDKIKVSNNFLRERGTINNGARGLRGETSKPQPPGPRSTAALMMTTMSRQQPSPVNGEMHIPVSEATLLHSEPAGTTRAYLDLSRRSEPSAAEKFLKLYEDFVARNRRLTVAGFNTNYESVFYSPYEWLLKAGTEYFFRYKGTQVIPPCRDRAEWVVLKDPIRVHKKQIVELHRLLAWRINPDNCAAETAGIKYENDNKVNVAREKQYLNSAHDLVFCECKDWTSKFVADQAWCSNWTTDTKYSRFYDNPYSFVTNEWLPGSGPQQLVSYTPGLLTSEFLGLKLSHGLTARLLATSGAPVTYDLGGQSSDVFLYLPDYARTFEDLRDWNEGGHIYVVNSENRTAGQGGVSAITFDADGNVVDYQYVLEGTRSNCGGGKTEWGAFISCEEYGGGLNWQVDPTGVRPAEVITLGNDTGIFESFAYDTRNWTSPYFFVTEDAVDGALQRWRPFAPDWADQWSILLGDGETDFLVLNPSDESETFGTYEWTTDRDAAKANAILYYPHTEGIEAREHQLFFVSKTRLSLFALNLDDGTYTRESTRGGLFKGGPDQIRTILSQNQQLLYFTEDGSKHAGIHARDEEGGYYTILESEVYEPETTGFAFSPDMQRMYVAYQVDGLLFEVTRIDGLPFDGITMNVRYHVS